MLKFVSKGAGLRHATTTSTSPSTSSGGASAYVTLCAGDRAVSVLVNVYRRFLILGRRYNGGMKIFGIGLQRTGTTSLYHALQVLGVRAAPDAIALFDDLDAPLVQQYDAFMDNPIPQLYQQLDARWPGSKFILTTRTQASWLDSAEWLFTHDLPRLSPELQAAAYKIHMAFYGVAAFDRAIFAERWQTYHAEVDRYFADREADLLRVDFTQGHGWAELCGFLGMAQPAVEFPRSNGRRLRWRDQLRGWLRSA